MSWWKRVNSKRGTSLNWLDEMDFGKTHGNIGHTIRLKMIMSTRWTLTVIFGSLGYFDLVRIRGHILGTHGYSVDTCHHFSTLHGPYSFTSSSLHFMCSYHVYTPSVCSIVFLLGA